jgi:transcriptional regulator with XRE-family HTH domain
MDVRKRFAANLKAARTGAGVSQQWVAERCSLHRTEISLLERGKREPRLGTLVKLATALGVSVERLTIGTTWDEDTQRFIVRPRPTLPPKRF